MVSCRSVSWVVLAVFALSALCVSQAPQSDAPAAPAATTSAAKVPDAPSAKVATPQPVPSKPGGAENNFHDFLRELASPLTPIAPAISAGIGMETNKDSAFGTGAHGYFNRYAVSFGDQFNGKLLRYFVMPTMFNQMEKYQPMGRGYSADARIAHAFVHSFVTKTRNGHNTINMSGLPASAAVAAIGMAYYPDYYTTSRYTLERAGFAQAGYFGGDLWTEFKPDICRAIHLPCGGKKK